MTAYLFIKNLNSQNNYKDLNEKIKDDIKNKPKGANSKFIYFKQRFSTSKIKQSISNYLEE
jgi:hypothetical protein